MEVGLHTFSRFIKKSDVAELAKYSRRSLKSLIRNDWP